VEDLYVDTATGSLYDCLAGVWTIISGGTGTPGGADTQVQYNDGGAFGAEAGFTYNKTTNVFTFPTPFTLGAVSVTPTGTELNYVAGVTSGIQDQINGKQSALGFTPLAPANNLSEVTAATARGNLSAQVDLGGTSRSSSGTVIPGATITSLTSGDLLCYDSSGTTWKNCEPGIATNPQTGTTYAILTGDKGKIVTLANGSAIAVSIAQAGSAGFDALWSVYVQNINAAGGTNVTLMPTTSTVNGAATLVIVPQESCLLSSNGAHYQALCSYLLVPLASGVSGALLPANGGTGATSLTVHGVVIGNSTSTVNVTGAGSSGQVLTSNGAGADPTFQASSGGITDPTSTKYVEAITPNGSTTGNGFSIFGQEATAFATVGSITVVAPTSTTQLYAVYTTSGVATNFGGWRGTLAVWTPNVGGFTWQTKAKISATTEIRAFIGVADQNVSDMLTADNPNGHYAGFTYCKDSGSNCTVDRTNFFACTGTASGSQTCTDTGVAADTAQHLFKIVDNGSSISFTIDSTTVSHSTNLPTNGLWDVISVQNRTDPTKALSFGGLYGKYN
jgi:hypothetical protein